MKQGEQEMKPTILVVDDEPAMGRLIVRLIKSEYEAEYVTSVNEALDVLMERTTDLVLSDVHMVDGGGRALYDALERSGRNGVCERIVFMTGGLLSASAEEFFEEKGRTPLRKPFTKEELHVFLKNGLDRLDA